MTTRWLAGRWTLLLATALLPSAPGLAAQAGPLGRAPSRFALFEGNRLHFKNLGTGRTALVLVHGWGGDLTVWREQADALAGRTRVVLLDLPGHGRSDKPRITYSIEYFARAVGAVLETAGVEHAVLVGHSMGVPVAREVARRQPERVAALVAVDGALVLPDVESESTRRALEGLRSAEYRTVVEQMVGDMVGGRAPAGLRAAVLQSALATPQHVLVSALEGMFDQSVWRADPIPVPVLAVMAKGPNWPPSYRPAVARIAADLTYEELDGVGHYLMLERPEVVNPILTRFLSNLQLLR